MRPRPLPHWSWLLLPLAEGLLACATQREQRPNAAEARSRPSDEPCVPKGTAPFAGAIWTCGYWHWDQVRYVWVDGRWQRVRK